MPRKLKLLFLLLTSLTSLKGFSQSIDPDDSFTFEIALPNSFYNKPYKTIMQGLVQSSAQYQYTLKNGLSFGAGLYYSYFAINPWF